MTFLSDAGSALTNVFPFNIAWDIGSTVGGWIGSSDYVQESVLNFASDNVTYNESETRFTSTGIGYKDVFLFGAVAVALFAFFKR